MDYFLTFEVFLTALRKNVFLGLSGYTVCVDIGIM